MIKTNEQTSLVHLTINNIPVEVPAGTTILHAAAAGGHSHPDALLRRAAAGHRCLSRLRRGNRRHAEPGLLVRDAGQQKA